MRTLHQYTDTFRELAVIYAGIILLGAAIFAHAEDKTYLDSIWWAFVTAMTVGYGDMFPVTLVGRIDGVILMHMVPLFIAPIIVTRLITRIIDDRHQFSHDEQEQLKADLREIKAMLATRDSK
jgi:voltage-gated potassium channel